MSVNMQLVEFSVSHFCEKARWALDYKGIPYERVVLLPMAHLVAIRKFGVSKSTVPVLLDGADKIQCSSSIIDHIDAKHPERRLTPPEHLTEEARELEAFLDREVGVMIRRKLYDDLLPNKSLLVDMWCQEGPSYGRTFLSTGYPLARRVLARAYKVRPEPVARAEVRLNRAIDTLEERLSDSPWLLGDTFSRVDLTAAALLAPLFTPDEHPFAWPDPSRRSAEAQAWHDSYASRPIAAWVRQTYRTHRAPLEPPATA